MPNFGSRVLKVPLSKLVRTDNRSPARKRPACVLKRDASYQTDTNCQCDAAIWHNERPKSLRMNTEVCPPTENKALAQSMVSTMVTRDLARQVRISRSTASSVTR